MIGTSGNDLLNGSEGVDTLLGLSGEDTIAGFEGGDNLNGNQDRDTVLGGAGNDTVRGGRGEDLVRGEEGQDVLYGDKGSDVITGGPGNDIIYGNTGDDQINGNGENDIIYGGQNNDLVRGGQGDDLAWGDLGSDSLYGDKGDDSLFGGVSNGSGDQEGRDLLYGGDGADFINGNENADSLYGEDGADTLRGGQGADSIDGGLGNDILYGDKGADTLNGGSGEDTFVLGSNTGGPELSDADIIEDFDPSADFIGLTGGQSFSNLEISAGTGDFAGATILRDRTTNDYLAIILGVSPSVLGSSRFTTNIGSLSPSGGTEAPTEASGTAAPGTGDSQLGGPFPGLPASAAVATVLPTTAETPTTPETPTVVNTAPTDIALTASSIDENSANDTVIGNLSATDADALDTHTYSLIDDASGRFKISGNELQVADGTLLDFETNASHDITVRATDSSGNTVDKTLTINIGDVNETPTDIALSASNVLENSANDTIIGNLSATDPDAGDTHTYSLIDDASGRFKISGNELQVADGTLLDFETSTSHDITVRATDSSGNTFDQTFTINVNNASDGTPTDITLSANSVSENSANDTAIGDLSATDADAGDTHTYSLTDDAGGRFKISGAQLQVADGTLLDFETSTSHNVTVRATDSTGLTFDKNLTINVSDVNETPTDIALSASIVEENSTNDTVIGNLSATDPDAGDTHTYSLTDDAGGRFKISGNELQVANGTLLDFETNTSHDITLRATDSGGNTFDKTLTINVSNAANEAATDIALSASSVSENSANDTIIGNLSATDPDAGDTHTYSLTDDAGGRFKISGNELQVANGTLLDFETNTSHDITVRATDSGGLTFDKNLTINVSDVNETPTDIALSASSVSENSANDTIIGNLSATDPDAGDTHTYSLTDDAGGRFKISGNELQVANGTLLDFETNTSHDITVLATDSGGLTFNKTLTININDLNEPPVATDDSIPEEVLLSSPIEISTANLLSNDTDPNGDPLSLTAVSNAVNGTVSLSGTTVTFQANSGFSGAASFDYTVSDGNGGTDTGTANINVNLVSQLQLSAITSQTGLPVGAEGFAIDGEAAGNQSGGSVSAAGDVNGDGLADLIVGANRADPNGFYSGRSYVVFGKSNGTKVNLSAITSGTGGFAIDGEAAFDQSGVSVSAAGDVNGDGLADLIVGANGADPNGNSSGRSYVVFGKANGTKVNLSDITSGTGGFAIDGEAVRDYSGRPVSAAGDVNGDGLADLIVGASQADPNGNYSGRSYVVFGKTNGTKVNLSDITSGTGGFAIDGETAGDQSSVSVSAAGDVNGDGLADLIVGARFADPNGNNEGRSYVVFGKTDGTKVNLSNITSGTGGFAIDGEVAGDNSGASVSAAGDVNGDGLADLIVGASGADPNGLTSGRSYVVFGKTTTTTVNLSAVTAGTGGFAIDGEAAGDNSGSSVSAAGDVNGDGFADLIVGASQADPNGNNSGRSYVVFGKTTTTTVNLSDITSGTGGFAIEGEAASDSSGTSVSAAGDVNGDGFADLIVGASQADPNGNSSGRS